jgi:hypothetical protein
MVQQSSLKKERVLPASHFITRARRVLSFAEVDEKVAKMPVSRLRNYVLFCCLTIFYCNFDIDERIVLLLSIMCEI